MVHISTEVIAVRDDPDAEPLDAILLDTRKRRQHVVEWWGGYASQSVTFTPDEAVGRPGWRPLSMELPKDWQEGYLRAVGGRVEFVYGVPPPHRGSADDAILRDVTDLVCELASNFDCASVEGPTPHPPAGIRLELSCSALNTASVILYPSDDDIDVHMGEDTWIELLRHKRDRAARVGELHAILEAVVGGRYEETVWRVRGRITKSKAVLYGPDGKALRKSREWHRLESLVPDPRAKRTTKKYEPYS